MSSSRKAEDEEAPVGVEGLLVPNARASSYSSSSSSYRKSDSYASRRSSASSSRSTTTSVRRGVGSRHNSAHHTSSDESRDRSRSSSRSSNSSTSNRDVSENENNNNETDGEKAIANVEGGGDDHSGEGKEKRSSSGGNSGSPAAKSGSVSIVGLTFHPLSRRDKGEGGGALSSASSSTRRAAPDALHTRGASPFSRTGSLYAPSVAATEATAAPRSRSRPSQHLITPRSSRSHSSTLVLHEYIGGGDEAQKGVRGDNTEEDLGARSDRAHAAENSGHHRIIHDPEVIELARKIAFSAVPPTTRLGGVLAGGSKNGNFLESSNEGRLVDDQKQNPEQNVNTLSGAATDGSHGSKTLGCRHAQENKFAYPRPPWMKREMLEPTKSNQKKQVALSKKHERRTPSSSSSTSSASSSQPSTRRPSCAVPVSPLIANDHDNKSNNTSSPSATTTIPTAKRHGEEIVDESDKEPPQARPLRIESDKKLHKRKEEERRRNSKKKNKVNAASKNGSSREEAEDAKEDKGNAAVTPLSLPALMNANNANNNNGNTTANMMNTPFTSTMQLLSMNATTLAQQRSGGIRPPYLYPTVTQQEAYERSLPQKKRLSIDVTVPDHRGDDYSYLPPNVRKLYAQMRIEGRKRVVDVENNVAAGNRVASYDVSYGSHNKGANRDVPLRPATAATAPSAEEESRRREVAFTSSAPGTDGRGQLVVARTPRPPQGTLVHPISYINDIKKVFAAPPRMPTDLGPLPIPMPSTHVLPMRHHASPSGMSSASSPRGQSQGALAPFLIPTPPNRIVEKSAGVTRRRQVDNRGERKNKRRFSASLSSSSSVASSSSSTPSLATSSSSTRPNNGKKKSTHKKQSARQSPEDIASAVLVAAASAALPTISALPYIYGNKPPPDTSPPPKPQRKMPGGIGGGAFPMVPPYNHQHAGGGAAGHTKHSTLLNTNNSESLHSDSLALAQYLKLNSRSGLQQHQRNEAKFVAGSSGNHFIPSPPPQQQSSSLSARQAKVKGCATDSEDKARRYAIRWLAMAEAKEADETLARLGANKLKTKGMGGKGGKSPNSGGALLPRSPRNGRVRKYSYASNSTFSSNTFSLEERTGGAAAGGSRRSGAASLVGPEGSAGWSWGGGGREGSTALEEESFVEDSSSFATSGAPSRSASIGGISSQRSGSYGATPKASPSRRRKRARRDDDTPSPTYSSSSSASGYSTGNSSGSRRGKGAGNKSKGPTKAADGRRPIAQSSIALEIAKTAKKHLHQQGDIVPLTFDFVVPKRPVFSPEEDVHSSVGAAARPQQLRRAKPPTPPPTASRPTGNKSRSAAVGKRTHGVYHSNDIEGDPSDADDVRPRGAQAASQQPQQEEQREEKSNVHQTDENTDAAADDEREYSYEEQDNPEEKDIQSVKREKSVGDSPEEEEEAVQESEKDIVALARSLVSSSFKHPLEIVGASTFALLESTDTFAKATRAESSVEQLNEDICEQQREEANADQDDDDVEANEANEVAVAGITKETSSESDQAERSPARTSLHSEKANTKNNTIIDDAEAVVGTARTLAADSLRVPLAVCELEGNDTVTEVLSSVLATAEERRIARNFSNSSTIVLDRLSDNDARSHTIDDNEGFRHRGTHDTHSLSIVDKTKHTSAATVRSSASISSTSSSTSDSAGAKEDELAKVEDAEGADEGMQNNYMYITNNHLIVEPNSSSSEEEEEIREDADTDQESHHMREEEKSPSDGLDRRRGKGEPSSSSPQSNSSQSTRSSSRSEINKADKEETKSEGNGEDEDEENISEDKQSEANATEYENEKEGTKEEEEEQEPHHSVHYDQHDEGSGRSETARSIEEGRTPSVHQAEEERDDEEEDAKEADKEEEAEEEYTLDEYVNRILERAIEMTTTTVE